ncbi:MAG: alanine dehydrogenase [Deltaproteobacteria bacterium]|jgi:alanine dehydrogenase|nr:alanine dehydrogenase [Deltaproteobacteria bacterium]
MVVGIPKEIKSQEHRVGMTPAGVRTLIESGHQVIVESHAGEGSGFSDDHYRQAGAKVLDSHQDIFAQAELIVKVKEPLPSEYPCLRAEQLLFTFLHLAPVPELATALLDSGCTAIAYETVRTADGSLPLLLPMSEIAGRMATQVGAFYLQKENGGKGVLLGGAPGVRPGRVVVLGAGSVGSNALRIAVGMGADVTVIDIDQNRLMALDDHYGNRIHTMVANSQIIEEEVVRADLLIGAVLVAGERAPLLVSKDLVGAMEPGSVIVDVAVDQGGCIATTHPTTHADPVYSVNGIVHYGVANMPGAVSRTSTWALTNRTLPYVQKLAELGTAAFDRSEELKAGVNIQAGRIIHPGVAKSLGEKTCSSG